MCADCAEIVAVVVAEAPGGPPPPAAPSPPPALPDPGFTAQGITAQEELGGGAIAGIVIAALVCCCLACAVTVYMCLRDRNAEERLEANKLYPPLPGAAPAVESQNAALCAAPPLEPAESAAPSLGRVSAASAETDARGGRAVAPQPNLEVRVSRNTSITECERGGAASRMSATSVSQTPERGAAVAHLSEGIGPVSVCGRSNLLLIILLAPRPSSTQPGLAAGASVTRRWRGGHSCV